MQSCAARWLHVAASVAKPMGRKKKKQEVHLSLRLYPGQDDPLIQWLEQFEGRPYGAKSQAIREMLARAISGAPGPGADAPALDLAELRRVVEAAMASALAGFACTLQGKGHLVGVSGSRAAEDDETEDLLDALGEALVLGDDG